MPGQNAVQYNLHEYLFRSTSDGVIVATETLHILQVNPAAVSMLTVTADDLIGQHVNQVFSKYPNLLNLLRREGNQTLDVRLPRRRLAVGMASTLENGHRVVMLQDVTEKRDLESRREALVRAVAHDLRNPISAIGGYADLVEQFGELEASQVKFLKRIRQTASKLYDVADSLVNLAWIEAGMPLAHEQIALPKIIYTAIGTVEKLAQEKKIVIATSLQDPMPEVMGDPKRLELVIKSLLTNAILYSEPEKPIVIHTWETDGDVYCSVADRGFGIADNEHDLVFDRLFRSRDERVLELPGGGVGLTLSKTIIERHGGDIWATSNLGEGSTFTFVLPTIKE